MVEHERIVARRAELGLSQAELARRVGVSQPMIVEIEKGRVHTTKFVIELARALELQPQDIDPRYADHPPLQIISVEPLGELPVRRIVERGEYAEFLPSPIDSIARPTALANVRDAYAVLMHDDEMAPEFEAGDLLLVHPHLPAVAGYSYVFINAESEAVLVRRLTKQSSVHWLAKRWSPPAEEVGEIKLVRSEWPEPHRIIGKFSRG
ncbi:helix-turn-helix domain-containing protein [Methylorubrum populi]|uniref:helix-turn-helix domain-containing protein n=1 Tax=Methylorubrum populi TaxID=223967 RepID=UPI0031F99A04